MGRLFAVIAVMLVFNVHSVVVRADEYNKHIVHDKITDSVLTTCREHQQESQNPESNDALTTPTFSDAKIVAWLSAALPKIMSLDYVNLKQELLDGEHYFTPYGWCEFIEALSDANIIDATLTRKLEVKMVLHAEPRIVESGLKDGAYVWTAKTPVTFLFMSGGTAVKGIPEIDDTLVTKISRSASKTNPDGIGILQWVTVQE